MFVRSGLDRSHSAGDGIDRMPEPELLFCIGPATRRRAEAEPAGWPRSGWRWVATLDKDDPMLAIPLERLGFIIAKAREFDAEVPVEPDAATGSDAVDDDEREVL